MVGSSNWVLLYLGLEMQTFSISILLERNRGVYGMEGSLKHFTSYGVFSGGLVCLYSADLSDLKIIETLSGW